MWQALLSSIIVALLLAILPPINEKYLIVKSSNCVENLLTKDEKGRKYREWNNVIKGSFSRGRTETGKLYPIFSIKGLTVCRFIV